MKKVLGVLNVCTPENEAYLDSYEFENMGNLLAPTGHDYLLREYRVTEGEFPERIDECDAYLITGSPTAVYDERAWIAPLEDVVRLAYERAVPMVGICFGHQLIAQALGGRTEKSKKGWGLGLKEMAVYKRPDWLGAEFETEATSLYFCHKDQVVALPDGAQVLAGNEFCENGIFMIEGKVFAVQGHPEFTPEVMERAIDFVAAEDGDPAVVDQAREGMVKPADGVMMAHWIMRFLQEQEK